MKKYIYFVFTAVLLLMTSCLKGGMEDLPEYEEADIVGIQRVEYRYYSDKVSNIDGENIVKKIALQQSATIQDNSVSIEVTVPSAEGDFTESEREKVALTNIAVMASISTAARLTPLDGAPKLGVPGDWSKPNKYLITAASGAQKEWTIEVVKLKK